MGGLNAPFLLRIIPLYIFRKEVDRLNYLTTEDGKPINENNPLDVKGSVQLSGSNVAQDGSVKTTLTTSLDSDYDSINVNKMGKGGVTTAHNAITETATSAEIDCRGYNSVLLEISQSAAEAWTYTVQGCMVSGGTFVDVYEMANTGVLAAMTIVENTLNRIVVFRGIPDYIKIVATEVAGTATVTVKVQPCNL
jgi:hypothetical protein